jgi:hypothetical protein|tara:strand:+ start:731 stop:1006 length:276 start_codon:yes stop_codon:yes gene_type:complete
MAFKMKGFSAFTKDKETKKDRLTKSMKLQEGEDKDTFIPKGKQSMSELIGDIEDRIEFLGEDVNSGRKTQKEVNPTIRRLRKRLNYLRQNK